MIGRSDLHRWVPKDPTANVKRRLEINERAEGDPGFQADVVDWCRWDILFYINAFVWQYNPKHVGLEIGPFITYEFQDQAILKTLKRLIEDQGDMLWEKSREMGATWMALILEDWLCLFHSWKKFLAISHSEQAVDRAGDPDSLFWKVQFMHDKLPPWLLQGAGKRKLGFNYPSTNSSFNGAASTGRSGVGGRATAVLLDELGKQQQAYEIVGQTADTGPRLFVSTHYGLATTFYDLCQRPDLPKIVMHWSQHPEKNKGLYSYDPTSHAITILDVEWHKQNPGYEFVTDGKPSGGPYPFIRSPWYDNECRRRGNSRDVATHLDIHAAASEVQYFDTITMRLLQEQYCYSPQWTGELRYGPNGDFKELIKCPGKLQLWMNPEGPSGIPPDRYGIGIDIAQGTGATPSCVVVASSTTGEQVAEYADAHIPPEQLGLFVYSLGKLFNNALVCWENNAGPGAMFAKTLLGLGYSNIYLQTDEAPHTLRMTVSDRPGWGADPTSKRLLLDELRSALQTRQFVVHSEAVFKETGSFKYDRGGNVEHAEELSRNDPSGARVNHGDRVIAAGLCWKMMQILGSGQREKRVEELPAPHNSLAGRRSRAHNHGEVWA